MVFFFSLSLLSFPPSFPFLSLPPSHHSGYSSERRHTHLLLKYPKLTAYLLIFLHDPLRILTLSFSFSLCVQQCFLPLEGAQAEPVLMSFPYLLIGGLGLIKLLSKTRRDEFPSSFFPCHPFKSAEIHSLRFTHVLQKKRRKKESLRGEGRGKTDEGRVVREERK